MKILTFFLYSNVDAQVKYAAVEMLTQMGLPFKEIDDLSAFNRANEVSPVLILPETATINSEKSEAIKQFDSVVLSGCHAETLFPELGCEVLAFEGKNPPEISGVIKTKDLETAPFFYKFPVLRLGRNEFEKSAEIAYGNRNCVGVIFCEQNGMSHCIVAPQVFKSAAYILSGSEATLPREVLTSSGLVDSYGRIDARKTDLCKKGFAQTPVINLYEKLLFRVFLEFSKRKRSALIHKWFFPAKHSMAVCLTHDADAVLTRVETTIDAIINLKDRKAKHALAKSILALTAVASDLLLRTHIVNNRNSLRLLPKSKMNRLLRYNPSLDVNKYLSIERRFHAKSSFYFLLNSTRNDSDYDFRDPFINDLMTSLAMSGCEVGLHASFDSYNDEQMISREKHLLEKALGKPVEGVRQHFLRIQVPDTWKHQKNAGLLYDTTFGLSEIVGFRAGVCLPYHLWDFRNASPIQLLEIPLTIMDRTLFDRSYMALPPQKAFDECKSIIDVVHAFNGVITLLWHPYSNSSNLRTGQLWSDLYEKILMYSSDFDPWFTFGRELAEWWNLRGKVAFRELPASESEADFLVESPEALEKLSIRVYLLGRLKNARVVVNGEELDEPDILRGQEFLLFCFPALKGKNEVRVLL